MNITLYNTFTLYFIVFLCTCDYYVTSVADIYQWNNIKSTDFNNQKNWQPLPTEKDCLQRNLIFPKKIPLLLVNNEVISNSWILPLDGNIVLGKNSLIIFKESSINCKVQHYNHSEPDNWYDPNNWCRKTLGGKKVNLDSSRACYRSALETENVPSGNSEAQFSDKHFYSIHLPRTPFVRLGTLFLGNQKYRSSNDAKWLAKKSHWRSQFKTNGEYVDPIRSIRLESANCGTQCDLLQHNKEAIRTICSLVILKEAKCRNPLSNIRGACMQKCGAQLIFQPKSTFNLHNFIELVWYVTSKTSPYIPASVSYIDSNRIQVVISDEDGEAAIHAAKMLLELLKIKSHFVKLPGQVYYSGESFPFTQIPYTTRFLETNGSMEEQVGGKLTGKVTLTISLIITAIVILAISTYVIFRKFRSYCWRSPPTGETRVRWRRQENTSQEMTEITHFENPAFQLPDMEKQPDC